MKRLGYILAFILVLIPIQVLAADGFSVSPTSVNINVGESKTITITSKNSVGKLNISSSDKGVATASESSIFMETPGSSKTFTITGKEEGTAYISVVATSDYATMDEEKLEGQTKKITVKVSEKSNDNNQKKNNTSDKSNNNALKELKVDGYDLTKVDAKNYTLTVPTDVTEINIKATAEDSKAKVSGTGDKKLDIGENNIEIVITSESGKKNKINIKVTRKDGYYLEDLPTLLNNSDNNIDIIIDSDDKVSLDLLESIKNSGKTVNFNYYNSDGKLLYSWITNGTKVNAKNDFITTINFESSNKKTISKLSNYADGILVNVNQSPELPKQIRIKINVDGKYEEGDLVNIYSYVEKDNKLLLIKDNLKVSGGFIDFEITESSDYLITMSNVQTEMLNNAEPKQSSNTTTIALIVLGAAAIISIGIVLAKKKNEPVVSVSKENSEPSSFNNHQDSNLDFSNQNTDNKSDNYDSQGSNSDIFKY